MLRRNVLAVLLALPVALAAQQRPSTPPDTSDDFRWLEEMKGERAMAWVRAENAKTQAVLEKDPRFRRLYDEALTVAQAADRIPFVTFIGGQLYNFWQDSAHVRGVWRRTSLASYQTKAPQWTTVLDLDTLSKAENANWVWKGSDCSWPAENRCLVFLSDGGEDAVTAREIDLPSRTFVKNGFTLPKAKMRTAWQGQDTLLIATEWKPGELTASGYPFIVKRLVRGQAPSEATEIFRGDAKDGGYGVNPSTIGDADGHRIILIERPISTFESEKYVVRANDVARTSVPLKSGVVGMQNGRAIVLLSEAWADVRSGSLAAFKSSDAARDPSHLAPTPIYQPGPRESIGGADVTRTQVLISMHRNVNGVVLAATRGEDGRWTTKSFDLPASVSSYVSSADPHGSAAFISVTGFLTPSSVWLADVGKMKVARVKSVAPKFDASRDVVEQLEATSTDGTKIPYYVVHPKGMHLDGANPTILYAYGGFEISLTPNYSASLGKLWLEQGGVYALANIRGGGEFGPAWHDAGLKTKRQIIYDDFAAVAKDLIARKITSPTRLGIMGGSNGGLLMGVEMTQHPELWGAVDIAVPLLDMLRFEQIQAGTSWVGEYGSVSVPAERAFLQTISPYHNLRPGVKYPEALVWTTTKDDRVGPQHARKFAAKLSAMGMPYLFYEVIEGGHGAGANLKEQAHTSALEYTYFARKLMEAPRITP